MVSEFTINPNSIYDDGALINALGLASATLKAARRAGQLRFTKKGNRILYLGQWIVDWMAEEKTPKSPPHDQNGSEKPKEL